MDYPYTMTYIQETIEHLQWLLENGVEVAGFYAPTMLRNLRVCKMEFGGRDITNELNRKDEKGGAE